MANAHIKVFSMFSGILGFELGIERALGKENVEFVGRSEIDKYAEQIAARYHPHVKNFGDARRIVPEDIPDYDLHTSGFPCQSFSIAGKRGGFEDTRGTLFFEIARIIKAKRPELLLLENVKGLLSHDNGRTFGTILATLSELGYVCEWQVLNSKNFGVPQNRERVFIIGHLGGIGRRTVFPINQGSRGDNEPQGEAQGDGAWIRGNDSQSIANTLAQRDYKGGNNLIAKRTPLKFLQRNQKNIEGDYAFTVDGANTGGVMIRDGRDNRSCLRAGRTPEVGIKGTSIRRLTPTECMFLQGFPRDWTRWGVDNATPEMYNRDYVNAKKTDTIKILQELWEAINSGSRKRWGITEFITFLEKEVLQSGMYEASIQGNMERECSTPTGELQSKAVSYCNRMFYLWSQEMPRYSPQEQKQIGQFVRELASIVSKLPHEITPQGRWLESSQTKQKSQRAIHFTLISDTSQYRCLGNAVTVNVIEALANAIFSTRELDKTPSGMI